MTGLEVGRAPHQRMECVRPYRSVPRAVCVAQPPAVWPQKRRRDTLEMQEAPPAFWLFLTERLELDGSSGIDRVWNALDKVVGRGTVQRIRDGHSKLGADTVQALARKLGCTPADLQTALLGQTQVAHGLSYMPDTLPQKTREQLMSENPHGEFWVELWDDAIAAELPRGTPTLWDAGLEPEPGDFVLLRTKEDGLPHVRVYAQAFGAAWEGRPLHDSYATIPGGAASVLAVFVSAKQRRSQRRR